jgi:hypothetical protein
MSSVTVCLSSADASEYDDESAPVGAEELEHSARSSSPPTPGPLRRGQFGRVGHCELAAEEFHTRRSICYLT